MRALSFALTSLLSCQVASCGAVVPQVNEAWEGRDVNGRMAYFIKKNIFCELTKAIDDVNSLGEGKGPPLIPNDYGVQLQTTITVEESTATNPTVTYNNTLPNALSNGVPVGQFFNLGFGVGASTTATRIDTAYTYWQIGKINNGQALAFCNDNDKINRNGSSPLLRSELGIYDYLKGAVEQAVYINSSDRGKAKAPKLDIYSYEIKFVVLTSGNINPTWKLVNVSGGGGLPFTSTGRTRTHDLILTFGPNAENGLGPSYEAANVHQTSQLRGALDSRNPQP